MSRVKFLSKWFRDSGRRGGKPPRRPARARLALQALDDRCLPSVVAGGGFESPAVGSGAFGAFRYGPAGTPWAFAGGAGVAGNGSGFTSGNPNAPEDSQVGYLQFTGSFSQTVNLAAGTYRLTFLAAQRGNFQPGGPQTVRVLVDGQAVGTFTPTFTAYAGFTTAVFTVAAGPHTIVFQGLDPSVGVSTAFIDNVDLSPTPPPPAAAVSNAGFESPAVGSGAFGAFRYQPADTAWLFIGAAGVSGNGSGFTAGNPNAPQGAQVAFLQQTGRFLQFVNLAAGTYQLSFQAAQRGNFQASRQDFRVLVDGRVVGTFTPGSTAYASFTTGAFTVPASTG